ncbi:MAG TPA: DUF4159 domain-containing protein [Tepidisphaeraceae bacterium]|jgi:hypothetical protein
MMYRRSTGGRGLVQRTKTFLLACAAFGLLCLVDGTPASAATGEQVDKAVDKAAAWLLAHQGKGNWEIVQTPNQTRSFKNDQELFGGQWTGQTAVVAYTLLTAGVSPNETHLASAIDFLSKTETHGTYALGVRCLLWSALDLNPKLKAVARRDLQYLVASMRAKGDARGLFFYMPPTAADADQYDHSASQFAALGAWSLEREGFEVPQEFWKLTDAAWRAHQYPTGAWSYTFNGPEDAGKQTASMTAAGVATLFITQESLRRGTECRGNPKDANIAHGLEWLGTNFDAVYDPTREAWQNQFWLPPEARPKLETYGLFAISRIGAASGLRQFGNVDWFQRGADYLMKAQAPDGTWKGKVSPIDGTALGALFLCYGRAPIVVNKLQYSLETGGKSAEARWNQRPQDVFNFVSWMGHQLESRFNWQIVNLDGPAETLHDAPILYIAGDQPLNLSQADKDKLRLFVQQGGMIVGNADCDNAAFSSSFTKLGTELFPSYSFRELPPTHPLMSGEQFTSTKWGRKARAMGLSNGVRELMLLPQLDAGRAFQGNNTGTRGEAYQLMDDIALYAVDKIGFGFRQKNPLPQPSATAPAGTPVTLARLQYEGNWDPEPYGWQRLSILLHNQAGIALTVTPVKLGDGTLSQYKLAHLTGTAAFSLSPTQRQELKQFIDAGGTLIVDAAGGSGPFAGSAERELQAIFGDAAAKSLSHPLPVDAPLYSIAGMKIDNVAYRPFARKSVVGNLKQPRIRAIQQGSRTACFYSPDDLSEGLVGQPVDGVIGYTPDVATSIMRNIVAFASAPGQQAK